MVATQSLFKGIPPYDGELLHMREEAEDEHCSPKSRPKNFPVHQLNLKIRMASRITIHALKSEVGLGILGLKTGQKPFASPTEKN